MTDLHDKIIYSADIDKRIAFLDGAKIQDVDDWDDDWDDELTALVSFRYDVVIRFGTKAWDSGISFVADHYWPEYAASTASDAYGEATETLFWDDEKWAASEQEDYTSFKLEETEYWTDGQR
jgi:hypothetical protein